MIIKQVDLTDFNQEVLEAEGLVLVDFGATWCAPCKKQLPILEKFAEHNSHVKVVKVDIDNSPDISNKYNIKSVPSLILFERGVQVGKKVGLSSLNQLNELIKK